MSSDFSALTTYEITAGPATARAMTWGGRLRIGGTDLWDAFVQWRLWTMLGWNDIRQRYRRSVIGPFWITLSTALFVALLGVIYAKIFQMQIADYLPYVAMGIITWGFISGAATDCCGAFLEGGGIIKQIKLPQSLFVLRVIWRSFIILLHTIVLIVPLALIFKIRMGPVALLALPGLALVFVNQIWLGIVIGVLATRYRDMVQLINTTIQITMFATPIMWPVSALHGAHFIADVNPAYHLIELVRTPLLGTAPAALSWLVVSGICIPGYALAALLLWRARDRIVYWL